MLIGWVIGQANLAPHDCLNVKGDQKGSQENQSEAKIQKVYNGRGSLSFSVEPKPKSDEKEACNKYYPKQFSFTTLLFRGTSAFWTAISSIILAVITFMQVMLYRQIHRDGLVRDRAYVTFKGCNVSFQSKCTVSRGYHGFTIGVGFGNSGNSPTRWGVARSSFLVPEHANCDPSRIKFAELGDHEPGYALIGPRDIQGVGTHNWGYNHPQILRDGLVIFVWGWFEYNDIFDCETRHRVEFCNKITIRVDFGNWEYIFAEVTGFGAFNGADDECLHERQTLPSAWKPGMSWRRELPPLRPGGLFS